MFRFLPGAVTDSVNKEPSGIELPKTHDVTELGLPSNLSAFIAERLKAQSSNIYAETLEMMERY